MKLYRTRVLERRYIGEHVLLRYEWHEPEPEPGQFVGVRVGDSLDPFLPRPFFVHDREEGEISLLFKVRGRGTESLAAARDQIMVSAPRGRGFELDVAGPAALIGGGVWVAPLRFLGRRLRERGVSYRLFLEAPPEAPEHYLRWLAEAHPEAEIVATDGSPGAVMSALDSLDGYETVYASGDRETLRFVREVRADAQLAVRERMACMDGSCQGCAVPIRAGAGIIYKRDCVDGPVFFAGDLAW